MALRHKVRADSRPPGRARLPCGGSVRRRLLGDLPRSLRDIPLGHYSGRPIPELAPPSPPPPEGRRDPAQAAAVTRQLARAYVDRPRWAEGSAGVPTGGFAVLPAPKRTRRSSAEKAPGARLCGGCAARRRAARHQSSQQHSSQQQLRADSLAVSTVLAAAMNSPAACEPASATPAAAGTAAADPTCARPPQGRLAGATLRLNGLRERALRVVLGQGDGSEQGDEAGPPLAASARPGAPPFARSARRSRHGSNVWAAMGPTDRAELERQLEALAASASELRAGVQRRQQPGQQQQQQGPGNAAEGWLMRRQSTTALGASLPRPPLSPTQRNIPPRPRTAVSRAAADGPGAAAGGDLRRGDELGAAARRLPPRPMSAPLVAPNRRGLGAAVGVNLSPGERRRVRKQHEEERAELERRAARRAQAKKKASELDSEARRAQAGVACAADWLGKMTVPDSGAECRSPRAAWVKAERARARDALRRFEQLEYEDWLVHQQIGEQLDAKLRDAAERKRRLDDEAIRGPRQRLWLTLCPLSAFTSSRLQAAQQQREEQVNFFERQRAMVRMRMHLMPIVRRHRERRKRAKAVLCRFVTQWRVWRECQNLRKCVSIIVQLLRGAAQMAAIKKQVRGFILSVKRAQQVSKRFLTRRRAQRDILLLQFNAIEEKMISGVKNVSEDVNRLRHEIRVLAAQKGWISASRGDSHQVIRAIEQALSSGTAQKRSTARQPSTQGDAGGGTGQSPLLAAPSSMRRAPRGSSAACGDDVAAGGSPARPQSAAASEAKRERVLMAMAMLGGDQLPEPALRELGENHGLLHKRPFTPHQVKMKVIAEATKERSREFRLQCERYKERQRQIQRERRVADAQRVLKGEQVPARENTESFVSKDNPKPVWPIVLTPERMQHYVVSGRLAAELYVPQQYQWAA